VKHRKKIAFAIIFALVFWVQMYNGHDSAYSLGYAGAAMVAYGALGVVIWRGLRVTFQNWKGGLKTWLAS
jgi:hypothetical protein